MGNVMAEPSIYPPEMTSFGDHLAQFSERLTQVIAQIQVDQGEEADFKGLIAFAQVLQRSYQTEVLPLLPTLGEPIWHSVLTELTRYTRLLGLDLAFLQTAKQWPRRLERLEQMQERLEQARGVWRVGFC
jgi:hypothetical protein